MLDLFKFLRPDITDILAKLDQAKQDAIKTLDAHAAAQDVVIDSHSNTIAVLSKKVSEAQKEADDAKNAVEHLTKTMLYPQAKAKPYVRDPFGSGSQS